MVLYLTVWDSEGNKIRGLSQWDINRELRIGGLRLTEPPIIHIWTPDSEEADVIQASYEARVVKFVVEKHYAAAKKAGLNVGAYWYCYALTIQEAKQEANAFIRTLNGKQFEMPVYYDIEERKTFNTGKANVSNIVTVFCTALEDAGYYCGIYGGQELAQNYMTAAQTTRYAFWLAQYLRNPRYDGQYGMWQFGVAGAGLGNNPSGVKYVPGVPGQCDLDYCYVDYPTIIKQRGRNGFSICEDKQKAPVDLPDTLPDVMPAPTENVTQKPDVGQNPEQKDYPTPGRALRKGDSGEDVMWLQTKLTESGYYAYDIDGKFGKLTLGGVLAYQLENSLEVDGVCGAKTRASLMSR